MDNITSQTYISELKKDAYQKTQLYKCIKEYFSSFRQNSSKEESNSNIDNTNDLKLFSCEIFKPNQPLSLKYKRKLCNRYKCLESYCETKYVNENEGRYTFPFNWSPFFLGTNQMNIRSSQYIRNLIYSTQVLAKKLSNKKEDKAIIEELVHELIADFQDLSTEVVFNPNNRLLSSTAFRTQCEFLNLILCPKELRKIQPKFEVNSYFGNPTFYFYDELDPFVCSVLSYLTLECERVAEQLCKECDRLSDPYLISDLRQSLFIRRAEKEFRRYVCLNNKTYKIYLNRLLNSVVAVPYLQVSSLETIKPIRLFEKIQQYIRARFNDNTELSNLEVRVCIIGYTEPSYNKDSEQYEERELFDLAKAIAYWLEEDYSTYSKTRFSVKIENLYNIYDAPRSIIKEDSFNCSKNKVDNKTKINQKICFNVNNNKDSVEIEAKEISYDWFNYNTTFFTDIIMENNDLIFLLDCPFLTEENYDIQRSFSLKEYCSSIREWDYFDYDNYPKLDEQRHSPMKILSSQYNRIMASHTRNAGDICRVFREYWVEDINKKLYENNNENSTRKVVYIFTSETESSAFFSLSSNPVCRMEQYEGKTFNIFRLANKKVSMLPVGPKTGKMKFRIDLWRMLKYASVDYAFNNFKDALEKQLKEFKNPLDIHALYRHIWIELSEKETFQTNNRYQLEVSVKADTEAVQQILVRNHINSDEDIKSLCKFINSFIFELYTTIYFPKKQTDAIFGDDILRDAFSMNLYSAAEDVWSLWFWHKYRQVLAKKEYMIFDVSYNMQEDFITKNAFESIQKEDNSDFNAASPQRKNISDFFKDKKIYDLIFRSLESSPSINPAIESLLYNIPEFYDIADNKKGKGYEIILGNVLSMYDEFVGDDSEFRENCRIALNNLL